MALGPDVTEMRPIDADEVEALLKAAFPWPEEAAMVRALRADGAMVMERFMRVKDRIGAYAGISRMIAPESWFALAPVAVLPEWQNGALARDRPYLRLGTRIVQQMASLFIEHPGILRKGLGIASTPTLVVLRKPSFYARRGFLHPRAARLTGPYPVASTLIAHEGTDAPQETLVYPPAFEGV